MGTLMVSAVPAFAVDPVAPTDPTATAGTVLANAGNSLLSTLSAMAGNAWVLALFGVGIALAIATRVINKHKHVKTPVG